MAAACIAAGLPQSGDDPGASPPIPSARVVQAIVTQIGVAAFLLAIGMIAVRGEANTPTPVHPGSETEGATGAAEAGRTGPRSAAR